jgi:hypothetical protein
MAVTVALLSRRESTTYAIFEGAGLYLKTMKNAK